MDYYELLPLKEIKRVIDLTDNSVQQPEKIV